MNAFFAAHSSEIFALINSIFVVVLLPMFGAWLRNHLNEKRASRVENAVQAGLQAAIAAATAGKNSRDTIKAVLGDPTVRANVVSLAQDYVNKTVPQTVAKLGISGSVADIISARVESAVAKLADNYTAANKAIAAASETDQTAGASAI